MLEWPSVSSRSSVPVKKLPSSKLIVVYPKDIKTLDRDLKSLKKNGYCRRSPVIVYFVVKNLKITIIFFALSSKDPEG